jgi:TolB-like protein
MRTLLLAVCVVGSGCAATMGRYEHRGPSPAPAAKTELRVGVVPPVDERGSSGFLVMNMPAAAATLWLPLYPIGWNDYDRPEKQAKGSGTTIGRYLAEAARVELETTGLFSKVEVTDIANPTDFDVVLRVNVYETHHKQTYTAWGLSVVGMAFWLLGAPQGVATVNVDLGLTLMRASDGEVLLTDRQRVEASHWFGVWWGPPPAQTNDEAVESAFERFLAKVRRNIDEFSAKGRQGPRVVAREAANLAGKSVAVMPLRAGEGVAATTVASIGEVLLGEVSARLAQGKVIGMTDIENMLGLERLKDIAGCEDTTCAAEIGGALGVDFLVTGSVGRVGKYVIFTVTLIDVRNSKPAGRVTRKLEGGDMGMVIDAMPGAVDELL